MCVRVRYIILKAPTPLLFLANRLYHLRPVEGKGLKPVLLGKVRARLATRGIVFLERNSFE